MEFLLTTEGQSLTVMTQGTNLKNKPQEGTQRHTHSWDCQIIICYSCKYSKLDWKSSFYVYLSLFVVFAVYNFCSHFISLRLGLFFFPGSCAPSFNTHLYPVLDLLWLLFSLFEYCGVSLLLSVPLLVVRITTIVSDFMCFFSESLQLL